MPRTVQEIMNRELLTITPELPAHEARDLLRSFRIGAAPVIDEGRRPLGVVSLRDPLERGGETREHMRRPAPCVPVSMPIEDAARQLARLDAHHLVVVDSAGVVVGMLSSLDALRAMLGLPARHPPTFPHWDHATGVSWTDDWPLEEETAANAPAGAGVLALTIGHLGDPDSIVWVESCANVRERVQRLAGPPTPGEPVLARILALRGLRFRAAAVNDGSAQARIVALLRDRIANAPPSGGT
ncbi:MAG TPA: CBS domain-containing protein [Polyangiaceae bacterium]|nr:CBS domain-containing protein [Polyangiaceae bacterium]